MEERRREIGGGEGESHRDNEVKGKLVVACYILCVTWPSQGDKVAGDTTTITTIDPFLVDR